MPACPAAPSRRASLSVGIALLLLTTTLVGTLAACSVPVFRYALEKWPSDPYELVIFHKGGLPADLQSIVERLRDDKHPAGRQFTNLHIRTVDLTNDPPEDLAPLWKEQQEAALPWLVVRYPLTHRIPSAWAGPFTPEAVTQLLDSPARQEMAKRVLKGQTGVWLFLESGDKAADEAAFKTLQAGLAKSQSKLTLPEIKAEDIREGLVSIDPTELRIEFSSIRLSSDNPAEKMLIEMLLGSEEDLRDLHKPMTFPVFGRGRVLYALVGDGISEEMVGEACKTLVGECTCQIKEQNPGIDLLMAIDWQNLVQPKFNEKPLPPLVGVSSLLGEGKNPADLKENATTERKSPEGKTNVDDAVASVSKKDVAAESETSPPTESGSVTPTARNSTSAPPASASTESGSSTVLRSTLLTAGAIVISVFVASLFLLRNKA